MLGGVRRSLKRGIGRLAYRKRYGVARFEWRGPKRTYAVQEILARIAIEEPASSACYAQSTNEESKRREYTRVSRASVETGTCRMYDAVHERDDVHSTLNGAEDTRG